MGDKEKFFQSLDKEAPDFTLQDADGKLVSRADLRGKVAVLHFIYAGCRDVRPLHADRIAEIQQMVNQTPMKEQELARTITTDPENDTPDDLRAYGAVQRPDHVYWAFIMKTQTQQRDATRRPRGAPRTE